METAEIIKRDELICQMRERGFPISLISQRLRISKERARQILKKNLRSTSHGLLTTKQLSEVCGITMNRLRTLIKVGIIKPVFTWNVGSRRYSVWDPIAKEEISKFNGTHYICRTCHRPLPKNRQWYCSEACRLQRWQFRNRTLEEKQKVLTSVKRYREKKRLKDLHKN